MSKLFGIGVGPGDKELLTLKAVGKIKECEVIIAPSAKEGGTSIALDIVREHIKDNTEVLIKHFPMGGGLQEKKINEASQLIIDELTKGKKVGFLTIGDPFVYSTYIYLLNNIIEKGFDTETIPGITSFCASASLARQPLVIGDEPLLILPATRVNEIKEEKFVVIMKVYKNEGRVLEVLEEKGFKYVCVRRVGRDGEKVLRNKEDIINTSDYMTLIIGRR